ncbi:MAG TPA: ribosomal protein S18-alanine N-acetyltransferase [Acidimicrobiia bacterium]|jgi:ribosomal-protein-alanine N-acetyltransferase
MADVTVRVFDDADIDRALEIERATYPTPWTPGIFAEELKAPGRTYIAAKSGEALVGYGGLMVVGEEAHITSLTVDPSRRGGRIGTRLMLELSRRAVAAGATSLTLEVRMSNQRAQSIYHRFGMAPVGVRKRYYQDEDALIMWVHDIAGEEFAHRLDDIATSLDGAAGGGS